MTADVHAGAMEKGSEAEIDRNYRTGTDASVSAGIATLIEERWRQIEASRERRWNASSKWLPARLLRRAFLVAKSLPVLPGRTVLELGSGSGIWTQHLAVVLAGHNSLTSVVFNTELVRLAQSRNLSNTTFVPAVDIQSQFSPEAFDYVVGSSILADDICPAALELVFRWLRPGGEFLFFMPNSRNPVMSFHKFLNRPSDGNEGTASQPVVNVRGWTDAAAQQGFEGIEATSCEVIPPLDSAVGQAIGLILERAPFARRFASIVTFRGRRLGRSSSETSPPVNLATHRQLFGTVSIVVPCHNEAANIDRLVTTLIGMYGDYIREIVIVDDNSSDATAEVATEMGREEPRVKVVRRKPPAGVGRALRDGYAAASGKYILSIDCDFVNVAPEFNELFDAVAEGWDGAIGSRFSSESALVRYPFLKILCNRVYHLLLNLLFGTRVRDITNNLKIYRAEILKGLDIENDHFAANVETGLKPLLLNYRIREVPMSWINRTADMGKSSFNLLKVGPGYLGALLRCAWRYWWGQFQAPR